jgi:hypothetical protein
MAALVLAVAAPTLSAAAPLHANAKSFVTIPPGTTLNVRLADTIHVNVGRPGQTYHAVLNRSVSVHRMVVIPRGASVLLRAVYINRSDSSDRVLLRAKSVSFGGRTYRIATSYVQARGKLVGGGPVTRASLGATAGTAGVSRENERVRISANTRFRFRLNAAVHVRQ